jgi:hypothetical protein
VFVAVLQESGLRLFQADQRSPMVVAAFSPLLGCDVGGALRSVARLLMGFGIASVASVALGLMKAAQAARNRSLNLIMGVADTRYCARCAIG